MKTDTLVLAVLVIGGFWLLSRSQVQVSLGGSSTSGTAVPSNKTARPGDSGDLFADVLHDATRLWNIVFPPPKTSASNT